MRNFHKKIFPILRKKQRKTHCVSCAKIAQKFAKKCAKIAQILRKRFGHRKFKLKTNLGKKKMSRNFLNENLLKGNFPSGNNYGIRTDGSHTENFDLFEVPYRLLSSWGKMYCRQQS